MASATQVAVSGTEISYAGPFLKWAGGKGQLLTKLTPFFPATFNRYFEPFMGSAAVFFSLRRTLGEFPAILMDANAELVNCFKIVKAKPDDLIPLLRQHQTTHDAKTYYKIRGQSPGDLSELRRAARFIYLNKTCYNGLYRVNASGKFNVPVGSYKNPRIFDRDALLAASTALKGAHISRGDFSATRDLATKGDFLYFDPPYYSDGSGFTGYAVAASGKALFGAEEHLRLCCVAERLARVGCHVIVSNSDTEFIRQIYKKAGFRISAVTARRFINCNGDGRSPVSELVITSS